MISPGDDFVSLGLECGIKTIELEAEYEDDKCWMLDTCTFTGGGLTVYRPREFSGGVYVRNGMPVESGMPECQMKIERGGHREVSSASCKSFGLTACTSDGVECWEPTPSWKGVSGWYKRGNEECYKIGNPKSEGGNRGVDGGR